MRVQIRQCADGIKVQECQPPLEAGRGSDSSWGLRGGGGLRWTPWFEPVSEARCRLLTSRTRREDSGRIFYSNLLQQQLEAIKFLYLIFTFKGIHGGWLGIQIASKDRK